MNTNYAGVEHSANNPESLSGNQLFQYCADHLCDEICWEEFLRRYQSLIARSVACAYRRFMRGDYAPPWRVAELAQEVYLKLLKDDCALLRRFRGENENAAEAYIAQIAMHAAGDVLRREAARKRRGEGQAASLDESPDLLDVSPRAQTFSLPAGLVERELIRTLARAGGDWQRDAAIYLLHLRLGLTVKEIVRTNLFHLQPTSVFGILVRVRSRLREGLHADRIRDYI